MIAGIDPEFRIGADHLLIFLFKLIKKPLCNQTERLLPNLKTLPYELSLLRKPLSITNCCNPQLVGDEFFAHFHDEKGFQSGLRNLTYLYCHQLLQILHQLHHLHLILLSLLKRHFRLHLTAHFVHPEWPDKYPDLQPAMLHLRLPF